MKITMKMKLVKRDGEYGFKLSLNGHPLFFPLSEVDREDGRECGLPLVDVYREALQAQLEKADRELQEFERLMR